MDKEKEEVRKREERNLKQSDYLKASTEGKGYDTYWGTNETCHACGGWKLWKKKKRRAEEWLDCQAKGINVSGYIK